MKNTNFISEKHEEIRVRLSRIKKPITWLAKESGIGRTYISIALNGGNTTILPQLERTIEREELVQNNNIKSSIEKEDLVQEQV